MEYPNAHILSYGARGLRSGMDLGAPRWRGRPSYILIRIGDRMDRRCHGAPTSSLQFRFSFAFFDRDSRRC